MLTQLSTYVRRACKRRVYLTAVAAEDVIDRHVPRQLWRPDKLVRELLKPISPRCPAPRREPPPRPPLVGIAVFVPAVCRRRKQAFVVAELCRPLKPSQAVWRRHCVVFEVDVIRAAPLAESNVQCRVNRNIATEPPVSSVRVPARAGGHFANHRLCGRALRVDDDAYPVLFDAVARSHRSHRATCVLRPATDRQGECLHGSRHRCW